MPFVLAVEPDPRQATILRRLVKEYVRAEVVCADTRERAIEALDRSVPDLVLVSVLLPPRDEVALTGHLRGLQGANHLETLTIPVLAPFAGSNGHRPKGFLASLGRRRKQPHESGCDPKVFAQEIRTYLERARAARAEAEAQAEARQALEPAKAGLATNEPDSLAAGSQSAGDPAAPPVTAATAAADRRPRGGRATERKRASSGARAESPAMEWAPPETAGGRVHTGQELPEPSRVAAAPQRLVDAISRPPAVEPPIELHAETVVLATPAPFDLVTGAIHVPGRAPFEPTSERVADAATSTVPRALEADAPPSFQLASEPLANVLLATIEPPFEHAPDPAADAVAVAVPQAIEADAPPSFELAPDPVANVLLATVEPPFDLASESAWDTGPVADELPLEPGPPPAEAGLALLEFAPDAAETDAPISFELAPDPVVDAAAVEPPFDLVPEPAVDTGPVADDLPLELEPAAVETGTPPLELVPDVVEADAPLSFELAPDPVVDAAAVEPPFDLVPEPAVDAGPVADDLPLELEPAPAETGTPPFGFAPQATVADEAGEDEQPVPAAEETGDSAEQDTGFAWFVEHWPVAAPVRAETEEPVAAPVRAETEEPARGTESGDAEGSVFERAAREPGEDWALRLLTTLAARCRHMSETSDSTGETGGDETVAFGSLPDVEPVVPASTTSPAVVVPAEVTGATAALVPLATVGCHQGLPRPPLVASPIFALDVRVRDVARRARRRPIAFLVPAADESLGPPPVTASPADMDLAASCETATIGLDGAAGEGADLVASASDEVFIDLGTLDVVAIEEPRPEALSPVPADVEWLKETVSALMREIEETRSARQQAQEEERAEPDPRSTAGAEETKRHIPQLRARLRRSLRAKGARLAPLALWVRREADEAPARQPRRTRRPVLDGLLDQLRIQASVARIGPATGCRIGSVRAVWTEREQLEPDGMPPIVILPKHLRRKNRLASNANGSPAPKQRSAAEPPSAGKPAPLAG